MRGEVEIHYIVISKASNKLLAQDLFKIKSQEGMEENGLSVGSAVPSHQLFHVSENRLLYLFPSFVFPPSPLHAKKCLYYIVLKRTIKVPLP